MHDNKPFYWDTSRNQAIGYYIIDFLPSPIISV